MELEEDLLSKTNEALFFCDLPGNFVENLLGLEATCWKDKAVDLLHPSCCRYISNYNSLTFRMRWCGSIP